MMKGYLPTGNPGNIDSYWCFRKPYWEGMMLLASSYGMEATAIVPLIVLVTFSGYTEAIGFGEDSMVVDSTMPVRPERSGT